MERKAKEVPFWKIVIVVVMVAVLLVVSTYAVLIYNNDRNAKRTGEVMINQMSGMLEKNQAAEETLLASLKDEYIIRAYTVAYMLENHPEAEYDVDELCKIADLLAIDEIHLFDESGEIYSGTLPKYYGYNFDSGEQMSYFKPMLEDKSLSMCQDVTPNTAEQKEMMYAITWDSTGEKMVQIGIAPVRLLKELENNEISNVVDSMPVYENLEIYVADAATGKIMGATSEQIGIRLEDIGIKSTNIKEDEIFHDHFTVNGKDSVCSILKNDKYVICTVQYMSGIRKDSVMPILLIILCLIIAVTALLAVIKSLLFIRKEQTEQLMILTSMSDIYYSMHLIDLENNSFTVYSEHNEVHEIVEEHGVKDAVMTMQAVMYATMSELYLEQGLEFTDLTTLTERLKDKKAIFKELLGKHVGWVRISFITLNRDSDGRAQKVICTTQIIDEEKRKEEKLIRESTTDKLTHCHNRRAYENELMHYADTLPGDDFVFVSMDVNGLKMINDTLGHAAGDELLMGAAECMQRCFGPYGRIYRMGGDEFVALLFASADKTEEIKADFEKTICEWSGELVTELSISCGYVTKREFPDATVKEMARFADERMYESKEKYYQLSGEHPRTS